jgi:hypothetical protein
MGKMMSSDADPDGWMNEIHFEMGLGTGQAQLGIITIELRKQHLWKLSQRVVEVVATL